MPDNRTLRQKLQAMADQDVSPNEAAIAREKLLTMGAGAEEPPVRPPAAPGFPMPSGWDGEIRVTYSSAGSGFINIDHVFIFYGRPSNASNR